MIFFNENKLKMCTKESTDSSHLVVRYFELILGGNLSNLIGIFDRILKISRILDLQRKAKTKWGVKPCNFYDLFLSPQLRFYRV